MIKFIALVPLFPLLGWLIISLLGKKLNKGTIGTLASFAVLASFVVSLFVFIEVSSNSGPHNIKLFDWITAGKFNASFSFLVDPLSSLFLLIITGIGFLIHLYSAGYMHEDDAFHRFFAYLNLFVFFMLLLVLGNNYLIMFVGWEGVGLCSYLLIGFWFKNNAYNNAAKKAFIMNRIGDLGFLLGILLIFVQFGSVTYSEVFAVAASPGAALSGNETVTAIALLLFIGAMGKSAQIPLYTWLPDAMAGPTPVSALIHAATMVTAGIYMVARSNILYTLSPVAMEFVAVVGLITALFAASIGLFQNDIKKVLAYSTVSQLGYMFLGLGVGAYTGAVFHVTTHAFFKALLFLGAGSVIHAMSGEQDIRNMGGLRKKLPVTFLTFILATIAISGIPPFSGFFSKDEILAHAWSHNKIYWLLGVIGSLMTAFYMFRLLFLTFYGTFRGTEKQAHHLHESPKSMTIPLIVLAVLSVLGGLIGVPEFIGHSLGHVPHALNEFLSPVFAASDIRIFHPHESASTEWSLVLLVVALILAVVYFAYHYYVKKNNLPAHNTDELSPVQKIIYNKYYIDELYEAVITKPINKIAAIMYRFVEINFIDAIVNGIGSLFVSLGNALRLLQSGYTGVYIFAMVIGIIIILFFGLM